MFADSRPINYVIRCVCRHQRQGGNQCRQGRRHRAGDFVRGSGNVRLDAARLPSLVHPTDVLSEQWRRASKSLSATSLCSEQCDGSNNVTLHTPVWLLFGEQIAMSVYYHGANTALWDRWCPWAYNIYYYYYCIVFIIHSENHWDDADGRDAGGVTVVVGINIIDLI